MSKSKMALGIVGALVKAAKPGGVAAAAAGAGAVAAQIGGALLKHVPQVASFAHGGAAQEAVVDVVGGVAIDAVGLTAAGMLLGKQNAVKLAPLVLGGTVLSAVAPIAAPYIEQLVDGVVGLVGGTPALPKPGGLADGVLDVIPGGARRGAVSDLW